MTIEQFIEADEMEQIEAIWDGRLIAETKDKDYNYKLYEIDSFYVETKQDIENGFIRMITAYGSKDEALLIRYNELKMN